MYDIILVNNYSSTDTNSMTMLCSNIDFDH